MVTVQSAISLVMNFLFMLLVNLVVLGVCMIAFLQWKQLKTKRFIIAVILLAIASFIASVIGRAIRGYLVQQQVLGLVASLVPTIIALLEVFVTFASLFFMALVILVGLLKMGIMRAIVTAIILALFANESLLFYLWGFITGMMGI